MVDHVDKNSFNRESIPIKQSNLIQESSTLSENNTFNSRVFYDNKKELSGSEEWDQSEAEWAAEQGEKEIEELKKKNEFSVMNYQQEEDITILDLVWGEKIVEWLSEVVVLTENQQKLNEGLLTALKGVNCSYVEIYNHSDFLYDRAGTERLEEFLNANKNDPDLQVVLNLRRGEGKRTVLEKMATRNISAVYLFLEAGADPNIGDKKGKTPLHCAAKYNNLHILNMLLEEKSININVQDSKGKTPLHYAAEESSEDAVIKLLDKGAKVDIQDKEGNTSLHISARCGCSNVTELLMEKNPNVNLKNKNGDTSLHLALYSKDTRVPESILGSAKNIDFNICDNKGDTPLLLAASLAQADVLREILKQGADIKCVNSEGNTALHYAVCNEYTGENCKTTKSDILAPDNDPLNSNSNDDSEDTPYKCVDELIYAGIEVNAKNNYDQTPLFFATEANNIKVIEQLLEKGADIKVQDKNGYTALHYAIKIKELEMLKALLPCKIDYDGEYGVETEEANTKKAKEILTKVIDNQGNTLLHWAVRYGCDRGILNFLVENGVDINAKNKNGVAPIHIAAKYGHAHLIDFFIENKADINVQCGNFTKSAIDITEKDFINVQGGSGDASSVIDVRNDTNYKDAPPISIAASNNHGNAIAQLLPQGAKPNIKDYRGWTPIQIAIRTACDEKCTEGEREKAYSIIETLAVFSNGIHLSKKAEANERIKKILENAMKSKDGNKLATAPMDEYVPSAPPLDNDFYDKIGSYVKDIPELCLYPSLYRLEKLEENTIDSRDEGRSIEQKPDKKPTKQKIDSVNKIRLTLRDREKLNEFSDKVAKSKGIAELNQVVDEALRSGIRLRQHNFMDLVMAKIAKMDGIKQNPQVASKIICQLVSKGADINKKNYEKINQELGDLYKDHKANIQKGYVEASDRISDFHEAAANAASNGKINLIEIDNTTFYLEYSADSTIDVGKAIEAARGLGLYNGNITFGSNIVKIGESEVEIETTNGIRNYTDLSDNGDVTITFQTSLGELDVRLYNSTQYKDFIQVEVCNPEIFNQLKEEIGKNCLFGELSVYDAITQGCFKRSGKLQSSETISCKRSKASETISFVSQDIKGKAEEIIGRISSTDIRSSGEDTWANRIQSKRTNESCSREM